MATGGALEVLEYFWPNGKQPGWALRWSVDGVYAHVDVCSATGCSDGKPENNVVMSDGGCGELMELDGPWREEFVVEFKFDGFARMWCEDLQLGTVGDAADLCALLQHLYARAEELIDMAKRNGL